jgi:hypothetical protein
MLSLFPYSEINEILPYLMGILGLLMTWELHDVEVRTGRIHGLDISDPSAIRKWARNYSGVSLYIYASPNDPFTCDACRKVNHTVFSPAQVRRNKKFNALASPCVNPAGCRCVLVGLRGRWPAGESLAGWLRENNGATAMLSAEEMTDLLKTADAGQSTDDRLGIYLLEALQAEGTDPQFAISRYRHLIIRGKHGRGHPFVVPAYLRLSDLLDRAGRSTEALDIIDDFCANVRYRKGLYAPTPAESSLLTRRKTRLERRLRNN